MYELYCLIDPRYNSIAYIGYTSRPKTRLSEHISVAHNINSKDRISYKSKWIRKLNKDNLKPIYKTLVLVNTEKEIKILEIDYIKYYKTFYKLKNGTLGGDGTTGHKHSEETRKKLSNSHKNILRPNKRLPVEILHSVSGEYLKLKDKTEAAKYIGCKEDAIISVSCGIRKRVFKWYVKLINENGGTSLQH